MSKVIHECEVKLKNSNDMGGFQKLKSKLQKAVTVSPDDPFCVQYFRSEASVRKERKRQLAISSIVIHPFSSFRRWYEIYLIFLYMSVLVTKPLDAGFFMTRYYRQLPFYKEYTLITDILCWIDIGVNFLTGFVIKTKNVELRPSAIGKRYISSPFFTCDVLSSLPKSLLYYKSIRKLLPGVAFIGVVNICCMFKIIRLISLLVCIGHTAQSAKAGSRGIFFLLCSLLSVLIVVHWMACLQFAVSRIIRMYFFPVLQEETWIMRLGLREATLVKQYTFAFFKSSAYILGVGVANIFEEKLPEEYIVAIFTYVIGKILVVSVWIILTLAMLSLRSAHIKFAEVINQVDEYMKQKQLPLNLRDKIFHYYRFKYQEKFFREKLVTDLLPVNIMQDVRKHVCRSLIANVNLFSDLTPDEISKIVRYLVSEIFLPNETIIHAGQQAEAMYFLSSGTVAVYTHSGKEVCHLQDGDYFGEVCLILKSETTLATIVAIETTQVYKLNRRHFEKFLLNNQGVMNKMVKFATDRLDEIMKVEEEYKMMLLTKAQEALIK